LSGETQKRTDLCTCQTNGWRLNLTWLPWRHSKHLHR